MVTLVPRMTQPFGDQPLAWEGPAHRLVWEYGFNRFADSSRRSLTDHIANPAIQIDHQPVPPIAGIENGRGVVKAGIGCIGTPWDSTAMTRRVLDIDAGGDVAKGSCASDGRKRPPSPI